MPQLALAMLEILGMENEMLELVIGEKKNPIAANELIMRLQGRPYEGTLYVGYPILASADDKLVIDAVLLTRQHGLIIFDLNEDDAETESRQDDIYAAVHRKLLGYKSLRSGRDLALPIQIVTFTPGLDSEGSTTNGVRVVSPRTLIQTLEEFPSISLDIFRALNAAIERVTTIRPARKRSSVAKADSRGAKLKEIEKQIANLDHWQKRAAIETPEGPQRIRGLAGSGKTIVLALKAAMLHAMYPQWRIALTFNTRSLYQQFNELVRRFTFEHTNDEPDWDKLRIIHAWGSARQSGIYSELSKATEFDPKDFGYAKNKYGQNEAFKGICAELLEHVKKAPSICLYDAVLIDEAQDLPQPFFELVYYATRDPKRIVWAYDELQNLGSYSMLPPTELFGTNPQGEPNVPSLENNAGKASEDLVLPVCYRNTPWALTVAHALGLGIYRDEGLVQYFEDQGLWEEIGYETVQGEARAGQHVVLRRKSESTPKYFEELLTPEDAVAVKQFRTIEDQMEWVATAIARNLTEDELEIDDILVIIPEPRSVAVDAAKLITLLEKHDISSHIVGITRSRDIVFDSETLAITGIFRAKGNEAPMVYILNSEFCAEGRELSRLRNMLFTAVTRSRAWVRICGVGEQMHSLELEIKHLVSKGFKLDFTIPTDDELTRIRRIHRELSEGERAKVKKAEKHATELLELLLSGEMDPENLPKDIQKRFKELFGGKTQG